MTYSVLTLAARRIREQEPGSGLITLTGAGRIGPHRPELHAQITPTAFPLARPLRPRHHQATESPEMINRECQTMLENQRKAQSSLAEKLRAVRTLARFFGPPGFTAPDIQTDLHPVRQRVITTVLLHNYLGNGKDTRSNIVLT